MVGKLIEDLLDDERFKVMRRYPLNTTCVPVTILQEGLTDVIAVSPIAFPGVGGTHRIALIIEQEPSQQARMLTTRSLHLAIFG